MILRSPLYAILLLQGDAVKFETLSGCVEENALLITEWLTFSVGCCLGAIFQWRFHVQSVSRELARRNRHWLSIDNQTARGYL